MRVGGTRLQTTTTRRDNARFCDKGRCRYLQKSLILEKSEGLIVVCFAVSMRAAEGADDGDDEDGETRRAWQEAEKKANNDADGRIGAGKNVQKGREGGGVAGGLRSEQDAAEYSPNANGRQKLYGNFWLRSWVRSSLRAIRVGSQTPSL